jgi:glucose-6-phosphate isomerase
MTYRLQIDSDLTRPDSALDDAVAAAVDHVRADLEEGRLHALSIARETADLDAIEDHARRIAADAGAVVVLGTGGSSFAGQTLVAAGGSATAPLPLHFVDNIDPATWRALSATFAETNPSFLVISKSGSTAETMAHFLLAAEEMAQCGRAPSSWLTAVTESGSRPLRDAAEAAGAPVLDHPGDVVGRFSALTVTALLPALLASLDIRAVRRGAVSVLDTFGREGVKSLPARGARLIAAQEEAGIGVQVMMPYADRLEPFARWWSQLWGESLGKDGKGSTPVPARGVTDQHSQLQLWRDGARRHMVTILGVEHDRDTRIMHTDLPELSYLDGRSLHALFQAECEATAESLAAAGVPVRLFELDAIEEETMGALFAHFMLETVLVAHLNGVDPFGQPAVEDGKQRARDKLRSMGQ